MRSLIIVWLVLLPVLTVIAGIEITNQISYGEIIAIVVSVAGGLLISGFSVWRWQKERSRRNRLITYPDTWKATRMLPKESFEVWVDIDILLPYNSYSVNLYVQTARKPLKMETVGCEPIVGSKKGRLRVTGNTPLALLPTDAREVELWTKITLDGAIRSKSKKRTVFITDHGATPSIPHKAGSQTRLASVRYL